MGSAAGQVSPPRSCLSRDRKLDALSIFGWKPETCPRSRNRRRFLWFGATALTNPPACCVHRPHQFQVRARSSVRQPTASHAIPSPAAGGAEVPLAQHAAGSPQPPLLRMWGSGVLGMLVFMESSRLQPAARFLGGAINTALSSHRRRPCRFVSDSTCDQADKYQESDHSQDAQPPRPVCLRLILGRQRKHRHPCNLGQGSRRLCRGRGLLHHNAQARAGGDSHLSLSGTNRE